MAPLETIIPATIGAVGSMGAALIGLANHRRVKEVHTAVNSRLDSALLKIDTLEQRLRDLNHEPPA
jgi:hypothetical protein